MVFARWLSYECTGCKRGSRVQPLPSGDLRPTPTCGGCGNEMSLVADSAHCAHADTFTFSTGKVKCQNCGITLQPRSRH